MLTVSMYAKLYGSIVGSSIWAEEDSVRLIWITMLALADREGFVYGSPVGLARMANVPTDATIAALKRLSEPEPYSGDRIRSPENEGRRIEETASGWRLLNYIYFRDLKDAETRRAQFRDSKRRSRGQSKNVNSGPPESTAVHPSDTDTDTVSSSRKKLASLAGRPSTLFEVQGYWSEAALSGDPAAFWDHFEANGWRQGGRATMKDWRAAARSWSRREPPSAAPTPPKSTGPSKETLRIEALHKQWAEDEKERATPEAKAKQAARAARIARGEE